MPIDAILFDKDGTLFDFANTWGAFGRNVLLRLADGDLQARRRTGARYRV